MSDKWDKKEILDLPKDWENFKEDEFNDWLYENMEALDSVLEIQGLIAEEREHKNSSLKRLDILASYLKDSGETSYVAIESQVTSSDFSHFGRLIMYMASSDKKPQLGVWIVRNAEDSHRQSVEWLNENTLMEYSFWLLSVQTVMVKGKAIGIEIVPLVKPDSEKRELYQEKKIEIQREKQKKITETGLLYSSFWKKFGEAEERSFSGKFGKAGRENRGWARLIGKNKTEISIWCSNNNLTINIVTTLSTVFENWKQKDFIQKLGEGWKYREGGYENSVYFIENTMFTSWQNEPAKWEEYSEAILKEASNALKVIEEK